MTAVWLGSFGLPTTWNLKSNARDFYQAELDLTQLDSPAVCTSAYPPSAAPTTPLVHPTEVVDAANTIDAIFRYSTITFPSLLRLFSKNTVQ